MSNIPSIVSSSDGQTFSPPPSSSHSKPLAFEHEQGHTPNSLHDTIPFNSDEGFTIEEIEGDDHDVDVRTPDQIEEVDSDTASDEERSDEDGKDSDSVIARRMRRLHCNDNALIRRRKGRPEQEWKPGVKRTHSESSFGGTDDYCVVIDDHDAISSARRTRRRVGYPAADQESDSTVIPGDSDDSGIRSDFEAGTGYHMRTLRPRLKPGHTGRPRARPRQESQDLAAPGEAMDVDMDV